MNHRITRSRGFRVLCAAALLGAGGGLSASAFAGTEIPTGNPREVRNGHPRPSDVPKTHWSSDAQVASVVHQHHAESSHRFVVWLLDLQQVRFGMEAKLMQLSAQNASPAKFAAVRAKAVKQAVAASGAAYVDLATIRDQSIQSLHQIVSVAIESGVEAISFEAGYQRQFVAHYARHQAAADFGG